MKYSFFSLLLDSYKVTLIVKSWTALESYACCIVRSKVTYKLFLCHRQLCLFICVEEAMFTACARYPVPEKCLPRWVSVSPIQENQGTGRGKCNAEIRHQLSLWSYPDTKNSIYEEGESQHIIGVRGGFRSLRTFLAIKILKGKD